MIKFNRHHVTNGTDKARVHYSLDNRVDGRKCVTLYAKDHAAGDVLCRLMLVHGVFSDATNSQVDYFEKGKATIFEGHTLYTSARAKAEQKMGAR